MAQKEQTQAGKIVSRGLTTFARCPCGHLNDPSKQLQPYSADVVTLECVGCGKRFRTPWVRNLGTGNDAGADSAVAEAEPVNRA